MIGDENIMLIIHADAINIRALLPAINTKI